MHGVRQMKHCSNGCYVWITWLELDSTVSYTCKTQHLPNVVYNKHFFFCNSQIQMIHSNSLMKQDKLV